MFAALAAHGHTYPLVPLAVAARKAGHDVVFVTGGQLLPSLRAAGLETVPAGMSIGEAFARFTPSATEPQDPERRVGTVFGDVLPRRWVADTAPLLETHQPDDEFQQHPDGLTTSVVAAQQSGTGVLGGLLLDRVAADGSFPACTPDTKLDTTYPLGGLLTHELLRGDPRKIVLTHSTVAVASGNHRAPGHRPIPDLIVPVHHFKWRAGVVADLRARIEHFTSGQWIEHTPAVRREADTLDQ